MHNPDLSYTFDLGTAGSVRLPLYYVVTDEQMYEAYAWLHEQTELGYDLETSGLNPRKDQIATIQVGNPLVADPRAYVIDVRCVSRAALRPLFDLLENPKVRKVGQNLKFEAKWSLHHFQVWLRTMYDSMVVELTCRAGLLDSEPAQLNGKQVKTTTQTTATLKDKRKAPKKAAAGGGGERKVYTPCSMGRMMSRYLKVDIDKDHWLRTSFFKTAPGEHDTRQIAYAAGDVVYPFYLRQLQAPMIAERGLSEILRIEHELLPIIANAELQGVRLDVDAWLKLADEAQVEYTRYQRELDGLVGFLNPTYDLFGEARPVNPWTGKVWNWDSPAQVRDAILAYCEHVKWPYEVVHSWQRIGELKREFGTAWLDKRNKQEQRQARDDNRAPKLLNAAMIPEWLIPDRFVLLPDTDGKRLNVLYTRNRLPREFIKPLMDLSKASQRVSTYGHQFVKKYVDEVDHHVRCEFHTLAAATGRLSAQPNCYDSETEIMTLRGWVKFDQLKSTDQVAQFDPEAGGEITFVTPTAVVKQSYIGPMIHLESDQIELLVTPNHRMLQQRRRSKNWEVVEAANFKPDCYHWHAGYYKGGQSPITPTQLRWLVALQADGHVRVDGYGVEFTFKRARKISRFEELCNELNIKYRKTVRPKDRGTRYFINNASFPEWAEFMRTEKSFGLWLLDCSASALDAFVEEIHLWDGSTSNRAYLSSIRQNVDWVQTVLALRGRRGRAWLHNRDTHTMHVLSTTREHRPVPYSMSTNVEPRVVQYNGTIHCVSVPTGFVLVRRESTDGTRKTSISGNTMAIPRGADYRSCFIPRAGYKFCIADLSQIEPRLLAQVSGDPTYVETYRAGKDLYVAVGERMYGVKIDKHTEEGKALRQRAKVAVLALAYMMGPAKFRNEFTAAMGADIVAGILVDLDLEEATTQRELFFEACPGIRPYQDDCIAQTSWTNPEQNQLYDDLVGDTVTYIKAPCGRIRLWTKEQNPYAEAPNFPIQGSSATGIKLAMLLLQRRIDAAGWDANILLPVHDELITEAREDIADLVSGAQRECMEAAFASFCPDVPIIAEYPEKSDGGVCDRWLK